LQKKRRKNEKKQIEERKQLVLSGVFSWDAFYSDKLEILPETGEPMTVNQALRRKEVFKNEEKMKRLQEEKKLAVMHQLVKNEKQKLHKQWDESKFRKNKINWKDKKFIKPTRKGRGINRVAPRYEKALIKDYEEYNQRYEDEKKREKDYFDEQERIKQRQQSQQKEESI